jgi:hypothetical protein
MKTIDRVVLSTTLAGLILIPWMAKATSPKDRARLEQGDIPLHYEKSPTGGMREVVGRVIFNAPLTLVWDVITDYHYYVDFVPGLDESRLIRREGPQAWQYLRYPNVWPLPDFECILLILEDREEGRISFQMISGDLDINYGSWHLERYDRNPDWTIATYKLMMDFGNLSPDFSKEWSNRGRVYDLLKAFRDRIEFERLKNAGEPGDVIKPRWRKALFWWERDSGGVSEKNPAEN